MEILLWVFVEIRIPIKKNIGFYNPAVLYAYTIFTFDFSLWLILSYSKEVKQSINKPSQPLLQTKAGWKQQEFTPPVL